MNLPEKSDVGADFKDDWELLLEATNQLAVLDNSITEPAKQKTNTKETVSAEGPVSASSLQVNLVDVVDSTTIPSADAFTETNSGAEAERVGQSPISALEKMLAERYKEGLSNGISERCLDAYASIMKKKIAIVAVFDAALFGCNGRAAREKFFTKGFPDPFPRFRLLEDKHQMPREHSEGKLCIVAFLLFEVISEKERWVRKLAERPEVAICKIEDATSEDLHTCWELLVSAVPSYSDGKSPQKSINATYSSPGTGHGKSDWETERKRRQQEAEAARAASRPCSSSFSPDSAKYSSRRPPPLNRPASSGHVARRTVENILGIGSTVSRAQREAENRMMAEIKAEKQDTRKKVRATREEINRAFD